MKTNQFDLKARIKQSLDALHLFQKAEHAPELLTLAAYVSFVDIEFAASFEKLSKAKVKEELQKFLHHSDLKFVHHLLSDKVEEVEFSILTRTFIEASSAYDNQQAYGKALAHELPTLLSNEFYYEFFTSNENLANLVLAIIDSQPIKRFYDGACGIGLVASQLNAEEYYLRDINQLPIAIAEVIFKLAGKKLNCQLQDSLTENELSNEVDLVVTTPPFGERINPNAIKTTPYLRQLFKAMPTNASDSAWIQQALYQLNDTGRAFLQVPSGWLFRGGYDLALRTELLENDWIDTIILLPKGFMQHTKIETVLLVLNKGAKQHDGIKMIDISDHVKQRTVLRPILSEESIKHIASVFHGQDDPDICKIVTVDEIRSKDMNLSFNKYFINEIEVTRFDLAKEKAKLEMLEQEYQAAKVKLNQLLSQI